MTSEDPLYLCTLYSLRVERGKSWLEFFFFLGRIEVQSRLIFLKVLARKGRENWLIPGIFLAYDQGTKIGVGSNITLWDIPK